jgi:protein-tyrosine phosphatase
MEDHQVPDVATLDRGAEYLSARLKEGKTVLVHCLAGEGRTGCVLAAYLIKEEQLGPLEALKRLREVKATFVERDQEKAVMEYGAAIR